MHAESLYTMLLPIEQNMDLSNFVHTVFTNLMLRMLRLEIPQESAEQIMKSYNGQAIFAKTKSRSLVGNLTNILKDIEAMLEYCDDVPCKNSSGLKSLLFNKLIFRISSATNRRNSVSYPTLRGNLHS